MNSSSADARPPLKKPKTEQSSLVSNNIPRSKIDEESPITVFDASKVAQLIQKIANRLDNNPKNDQKIDTPPNPPYDKEEMTDFSSNIFENMSKISTTTSKKDKLSNEEINEAKNESIDNLDLDQTKRYVLILRQLLQIKDVELRMAELKNFDSKKEIESVTNKLNVITKKMENFKSMLTPRQQNEKRCKSPAPVVVDIEKSSNDNDQQEIEKTQRHTEPLDVTSPEILSKFLDKKGNFDDIAYELVINAYEKFYLEFERDFKILDSKSLEQRKKSMRRFTNTQYWAWRKENFSLERCQQFLISLITFQFYNTTNLSRMAKNSLAAEICQLENSARKAAYLMLQHSDVAVVDYGRDMNNLWAGHDVQCKAREIAANSARGLWSNNEK